jgi:hypothetical protein
LWTIDKQGALTGSIDPVGGRQTAAQVVIREAPCGSAPKSG